MDARLSRLLLAAGAVVSALLASSCASVLHGTSQKVEVVTAPEGATATALGQTVRTPGVLVLPRKSVSLEIRIEKEGYAPQTVRLDRTGSRAVWWNLAGIPLGIAAGIAGSNIGNVGSNTAVGGLGGLGLTGLGFAADYGSGAAYELVPAKIVVGQSRSKRPPPQGDRRREQGFECLRHLSPTCDLLTVYLRPRRTPSSRSEERGALP